MIINLKKREFDEETKKTYQKAEEIKQKYDQLIKEGEAALNDYEKEHKHMKNIFNELGVPTLKVDEKFNDGKNKIRENLKLLYDNLDLLN